MYYSFKANFEQTMCTSLAEKRGMLQAAGYFYDDDPGTMSTATGADTKLAFERPAWKARRGLFTGGKVAEFSSPLHLDFFNQDRLLIPNNVLSLTITPQTSDFLVYAPFYKGEVKLELVYMRLEVTFVDLLASTAEALDKQIDNMVCYPIHRTVLKSQFFEPTRTESFNNINNEVQPRFGCFAFVKKEYYNGTPTTDPFHYEPFGIETLSVISADRQFPYTPWQLDFENGQFIRAFDHFNRTVEIDTGVTRSMYQKGWTLFPFNFTSTLEDDEGFDFIRVGPTILQTRFNTKTNLPSDGIVVLMYLRFDSVLFMDKTRNVHSDISV